MGEWFFERLTWTSVSHRVGHPIGDARVRWEVQVTAFGPPLADCTFGIEVA
jgi:hypothetical protein